jgi:hypothetical protein
MNFRNLIGMVFLSLLSFIQTIPAWGWEDPFFTYNGKRPWDLEASSHPSPLSLEEIRAQKAKAIPVFKEMKGVIQSLREVNLQVSIVSS